MYAMPNLSYGSEVIRSFDGLIKAMKCRQTRRPNCKFLLRLAGREIAVNLLSNGCVEVEGLVPQLEVQREIEDAIQQHGATLEEVRV